MSSLEVLPVDRLVSDHYPISFSWLGRPSDTAGPANVDYSSPSDNIDTPKVFGWRFRGTYTDEKCEVATAHLSEHPGVAQFIPTLRSEGPLAAYRLLHRMLRECWASSGISVSTDSGARADIDREPDPPVQDWFDDEVRAALHLWQKLRRIRNPSETTKKTIRAARYRYNKLSAEKQRCWHKSWARFWIDLTGFHSFWDILNIFAGRSKFQRCPLSAAAQCD